MVRNAEKRVNATIYDILCHLIIDRFGTLDNEGGSTARLLINKRYFIYLQS